MHKITFALLVIGGLNWGLEAAGYGIGNYIPEGFAFAKQLYFWLANRNLVFAQRNSFWSLPYLT